MNLSLAVGVLLLAGVAGGGLARKLGLPSVTGYLIIGILIGPSVSGLISSELLYRLEPINDLALGIIAFSIGAELRWSNLRRLGKDVSRVFLVEALLTLVLVGVMLSVFGFPYHYAVVFGVLSIATAPGAIIACIRETPIPGDFPKALLTVVALDNLLAIVLFGFVISFFQVAFATMSGSPWHALLIASQDLVIALSIGLVGGLFFAITVARSRNDSRLLVVSLGAVLVAVGLANLLQVPALLAAMTAGGVYVNLAKSPHRIGRALQPLEGPILLLFLTLAGVKLDLFAVPAVGQMGLVYILARFAAKLIGSRFGAYFTSFPLAWQQNIGRALTPQAGVAIGLAIIAEQKLPFADGTITTVILGAVVVFEIIGPILVKRALCQVK